MCNISKTQLRVAIFFIMSSLLLLFGCRGGEVEDESADLSGTTGMVVGVSGQPSQGDPTVTITTSADGDRTVVIETTSSESSSDPISWATVITAASVNEDSDFDATVTAIPADEETSVSYSLIASSSTCDDGSWSPPLSITAGDGIFSGTPTNADVGACTIVAEADGEGDKITMEFTLTINNTNDAPTWTTEVVDFTIDENVAITGKSVEAADIDVGDSLAYSIDAVNSTCDDGSWSSGPTVEASTGAITGTPTTADIGNCKIQLIADDGDAQITTAFFVVVSDVLQPPVWDSAIGSQTIAEDANITTLSLSADATDYDVGQTPTYSFDLVNMTCDDSGWTALSINTTSGDISGTPTNDAVGTCTMKVVATSVGDTIEELFTVTVTNTNDSPVWNPVIGDFSLAENAAISKTAAADDVDTVDTVTYSLETANMTCDSPVWGGTALSIDSSTGVFTGTPVAADIGACTVKVVASDGTVSISETFTITVTNVNDPPAWDATIADFNLNEDEDIGKSAAATDPDSDPVTYTLDTANMTCDDGGWSPALLLGSSNGVLAGKPTNADVGSCTIKVNATANGTTIAQSFTVTVLNTNDTPIWNPAITDFSVNQGDTIAKTAHATDDDAGASISYSLDTGNMTCDDKSWTSAPAVHSSTGALSGQPSFTHSDNCTIRVKATSDNTAESIYDDINVTVADNTLPNPPTSVTNSAFSTTSDSSPAISWTASNSVDVVSHKAYLGTTAGGGEVVDAQNTSTSSSHIFSTALMTLCNTYYVTVRAVDGQPNLSNPALSDTAFVYDPVAPVYVASTVSLDATTSSSATTSWTAFTEACAASPSYEIAVSTTNSVGGIISGGGWTSVGTSTSGKISAGITLALNTDYYSLVRSTDSAGNVSDVSASTAWKISILAVDNLGLAGRTFNSIDLGWTRPDMNGLTFDHSEYKYCKNAGSTPNCTSMGADPSGWADGASVTEESASIGSLLEDTSYKFAVRTVATIGVASDWSNVLTVDTLIDDAFFTDTYQAFNLGGAVTSTIVAMEIGTDMSIVTSYGPPVVATSVTCTGVGESSTGMSAGDICHFTSALGNHIKSNSKKFFVTGGVGDSNSGSSGSANIVWNHPNWAGKKFLLNGSRKSPHKVTIHTFQDGTNIEIRSGGVVKDSASNVAADTNIPFTLTEDLSYELTSDKYILGFIYSVDGVNGAYTDPIPLIPTSSDLIGIPSKKGQFSSGTDANSYNGWHSDDTAISGEFESGTVTTILPTGLDIEQYKSNSLRVISTDPIVARSNADGNGSCSSPFLPVTMMRKIYGLNEEADYVAFASTYPVVITVSTGSDVTLTRTGTDPKSPYKGYIAGPVPAGTIFTGDDRFAAWYQATDAMGAGENDETLMFGFD